LHSHDLAGGGGDLCVDVPIEARERRCGVAYRCGVRFGHNLFSDGVSLESHTTG
jgi:hypothetical protein